MGIEHSPARAAGTAEPFVNEREAAEFLKISVRTLQRWRTEPPAGGAPTFYRLGARRVTYRLSDLLAWATTRAYSSTAEADGAAK